MHTTHIWKWINKHQDIIWVVAFFPTWVFLTWLMWTSLGWWAVGLSFVLTIYVYGFSNPTGRSILRATFWGVYWQYYWKHISRRKSLKGYRLEVEALIKGGGSDNGQNQV